MSKMILISFTDSFQSVCVCVSVLNIDNGKE